ncbi:MAG: carboxymuconolactone decarboxylase family protein [Novosphingobium sp.]|nr:carboxymuconolactone decarboxylase family protein [Novosphingobium sp.]
MSNSDIRIPPLDVEEFTPEQAELVGNWTHLVFSRVIARRPDMYRIFVPWIEQLIAKTKLPPRDRQVLVLRTLALGNDTYEFHHHVMISKNAGISDEDIAAFAKGSEALSGFEQVLACAAEELVSDQFIADATWAALAERYGEEQLMEVVFLVGCYNTMAMLTRSFGMPLEGADEEFDKIQNLREYT